MDRGAYYHPGLGIRIPYGLDDRDYIQGTVTLIDNGPHTGGNVVFPKSHLYFRHIAETYHKPIAAQHAYINSGTCSAEYICIPNPSIIYPSFWVHL